VYIEASLLSIVAETGRFTDRRSRRIFMTTCWSLYASRARRLVYVKCYLPTVSVRKRNIKSVLTDNWICSEPFSTYRKVVPFYSPKPLWINNGLLLEQTAHGSAYLQSVAKRRDAQSRFAHPPTGTYFWRGCIMLCKYLSNFTTRKSFSRKIKKKHIIVKSIYPLLNSESKKC